MTDITEFYINGAWVTPAGTDTMPILNPANNSTIGAVTLGNSDDVDSAVAAAKEAFETWGLTPKAERRALLVKLLEISEAREEGNGASNHRRNGRTDHPFTRTTSGLWHRTFTVFHRGLRCNGRRRSSAEW